MPGEPWGQFFTSGCLSSDRGPSAAGRVLLPAPPGWPEEAGPQQLVLMIVTTTFLSFTVPPFTFSCLEGVGSLVLGQIVSTQK